MIPFKKKLNVKKWSDKTLLGKSERLFKVNTNTCKKVLCSSSLLSESSGFGEFSLVRRHCTHERPTSAAPLTPRCARIETVPPDHRLYTYTRCTVAVCLMIVHCIAFDTIGDERTSEIMIAFCGFL